MKQEKEKPYFIIISQKYCHIDMICGIKNVSQTKEYFKNIRFCIDYQCIIWYF